MTFKNANRVEETSTTTGTGTYTLDGASTGRQSFVSGVGANNHCTYVATDDTNWEIGIGQVLTGPNRLTREKILSSSNAGAAVNWGSGTRKIRQILAAEFAAPRVVTKSVAGGTDVTLTQDEQRCDILILTGALTASINVIVDATPWQWTVVNDTTGAFNCTLKTSSGTGFALPRNRAVSAICDGTNVRRGVEGFGIISSVSANTTVAASELGRVLRVTASCTISFDAVATLGASWHCHFLVESGATVTLDPAGSETIDGSATLAVSGPAALTVWCDGSALYSTYRGPRDLINSRLLDNVGLSVAMASNAVTITLTGADGSALSTSNRARIGFRSSTAASGNSSVVSVTSPVSLTISAGSTLGTENGVASRIWIAAINNGGTVELAAFNARSGTSIAAIDEGTLISTTAEGGAGGADSAQVWYSATARTSVPFTILGYFESTQATAGTWASSATVIAVNPRNRPGDILQVARTENSSLITANTAIPHDDTVPQSTEGTQIHSQTVTTISRANVFRITAFAAGAINDAPPLLALFRDSNASAFAVAMGSAMPSAGAKALCNLSAATVANNTGSTTFKVRAGLPSSSWHINGQNGPSRLYGGSHYSWMTVEEIMV